MKTKSSALFLGLLLLSGIAAIAFFTNNGVTTDESRPEDPVKAFFKPCGQPGLAPFQQAKQPKVEAPNPTSVPIMAYPNEQLEIRFGAFRSAGARRTACAEHTMTRLRLMLFPYHFFY